MTELPSSLKERLEKISHLNQVRSLKERRGLDFISNDYLGFAQDKNLIETFKKEISTLKSLGSSGSRLLRGNLEIFECVEKDLAEFSHREASLLLPTGFQANLALYSALLTSNDIVFSDEFNHASIIDGIRLSRAQCEVFQHNNLNSLLELLKKYKNHSGLKVIATESLFSMEGDLAPLKELAKLAREHNALLVVDEAHATGIYDSGLVQFLKIQDEVFATVHTGGKALGVSGAWIATSSAFKEYLINFSRPFIYSTAPQPLLAHALRVSLVYWKSEGAQRCENLKKNATFFLSKIKGRAKEFNFSIPENTLGPIIPIILGDNDRALQVALNLEKRGYDVRAIRPPTVPEGTARLRLTINSQHTEKILTQFIENFFNILERF